MNMYPNEYIKALYQKKLTKQDKIAFISAIIIGLISHMYMLTNKLPNYDDIKGLVNDYGVGIESGRWMLFVLGATVKRAVGNFSVPWLYGLISICFVAIAAVLVVRLLDIEDSLLCFLTGGIMVSFPTVTGTLFFMYTAPYYCLALVLSVAAILICRKNAGFIRPCLKSIILLAMSIGIYQAYFTFSAALCLIILIGECIGGKNNWKIILGSGIKYLLLLLGGMFLYMFTVKASLLVMERNLTGYQGIEQMGRIAPQQFSALLYAAYIRYFDLFFKTIPGINVYWVMKVAIIGTHLVVVLGIVYILLKTRREFLVIAESVVFVLLFPLAVNFIYVMVPNGSVYITMLYSIISMYLLEILTLQSLKNEVSLRKVSIPFNWIGSIILSVIVAVHCQYNNVQYLAMDMDYRQADSYFTTMISRIKSVNGYNAAMSVVFIGDEIEDSSFDGLSEFSQYELGGRGRILNAYSRNYFLRRYLGFGAEIIKDDGTRCMTPEVEKMPCYPDDGSIQIVNGEVIVKLE